MAKNGNSTIAKEMKEAYNPNLCDSIGLCRDFREGFHKAPDTIAPELKATGRYSMGGFLQLICGLFVL